MGKYIYESHMGGIYASDHLLSDDVLYCETCCDWDRELGYAKNAAEAREILKNLPCDLNENYLEPFIEGNFTKEDAMELTPKDKSTIQRMIGKIEGVAFAADEKIATPLLDAVEVIDAILDRLEDK